MEPLGLVAIVGLLFVKEAGLPVPIPGDLVVLGAGIGAARGQLEPVSALVAIVLAGIAGGLVQFTLVRTVARGPALRILARFGVGPERTEPLTARLRAGGARAVALSRATPGVRIAAIAAGGLAGLGYRPFAIGLAAGNATFVGAHFALGYVAGEPAIRAASVLGGQAVVALVALAAVGAAGWLVIGRRSRRPAPTSQGLAAAVDWADAACPVCLALALADGAAGAAAGRDAR